MPSSANFEPLASREQPFIAQFAMPRLKALMCWRPKSPRSVSLPICQWRDWDRRPPQQS
jgi:hypothetical protein